ncbi:MAG: hypothetical protein XD93_0479 [candidate division WS6 bacterium 34_10]|uniref:Uncharacterized protein n=1 Tax=candidate division WS6 bacterium 34_10 TaxID=1641389 RepID=A0A101HHV9_9BACT|nr:MAG: hypothetical protein XD93_0479 [candidate division WS6 bacterium 34_10]
MEVLNVLREEGRLEEAGKGRTGLYLSNLWKKGNKQDIKYSSQNC